MKKILLNTVRSTSPYYKKLFAYINDKDYVMINKHKWSAIRPSKTRVYAHTHINGKHIYMHTFIMGFKGIDHKDGNGLNNQRSNLRKATQSQNMMNRKPAIDRFSSNFKGVSWHKPYKKWHSKIKLNKKRIHLGYYDSEEQAALRYNQMANKLFGEFAYLNKI